MICVQPRPYSFQYEVRDPPSGNDYAQQESSDGNVVRGEYRVLLPDSRTQIVKYTADDANGYNADVQYEGQAQFPRGGGGAGPGGAPGGYNQFGLDAGYPAGGFGPVNNYQGGEFVNPHDRYRGGTCMILTIFSLPSFQIETLKNYPLFTKIIRFTSMNLPICWKS